MSINARFKWQRGEFRLEVDLTLPGRGVTGILGPSGSGKTSLLRAIAGLDRVPDGKLSVSGVDWQGSGLFVPAWQRDVGFVFQEPSLFAHLDVRGNLEFGLRRTAPARRRVSLEQAIELLGIAALLARRVDTLSGGERQRVAIARALAMSPRLLLLDEPLASLDRERKAEIMPWLEGLHRELDIPMLYVSHAPEELARLADHLVLLEQGRVTASGALNEILTRPDLALWHEPDAAAVIEARIAGHDSEWGLTRLEFDGGTLEVPQASLPAERRVRVRIAARDVSLALTRPQDCSILNVLPARVIHLAPEQASQVMVGLQVGQSTLMARITRKSASQLQLRPGLELFAQIKSVALLP